MKAEKKIVIEFTEQEKLAMSVMDKMWEDWKSIEGHCNISCSTCPFAARCNLCGDSYEETMRDALHTIFL